MARTNGAMKNTNLAITFRKSYVLRWPCGDLNGDAILFMVFPWVSSGAIARLHDLPMTSLLCLDLVRGTRCEPPLPTPNWCIFGTAYSRLQFSDDYGRKARDASSPWFDLRSMIKKQHSISDQWGIRNAIHMMKRKRSRSESPGDAHLNFSKRNAHGRAVVLGNFDVRYSVVFVDEKVCFVLCGTRQGGAALPATCLREHVWSGDVAHPRRILTQDRWTHAKW